MQHTVAADDGGVAVGEDGIGEAEFVREILRLRRRIDADGYRFDARGPKLVEAVLDSP
jgi:hypothetical protein